MITSEFDNEAADETFLVEFTPVYNDDYGVYSADWDESLHTPDENRIILAYLDKHAKNIEREFLKEFKEWAAD